MSAAPGEILMLNFLVEDKTPKSVSPDQILPRALRALRIHLGMDIAFIAQFRGGRRVFRYVDCAQPNDAIQVGASDAMDDSYCKHVLEGALPELIPDTSEIPAAQELAMTRLVPVGAHLSVPIRLYDGTVFGTLGCISTEADRSLGARDLSMMRVFAEMAAEHIEADLQVEDEKHDLTVSLKTVLTGDPISIVYQPVFDLKQAQVVGFESLARFTTTPVRAPNAWFADAARVGLDVALELKVLERALACFMHLPPGIYVAFNVSPNIVISGQLEVAFRNAPVNRIVLEVNEHVSIREYDEIAKAMAPLRERGLQVSVDDTGAGLSSFRHIVSLRPDIVKLPMSLTRNIDSDGARRALASALMQFANENAATIIAEGVETAAELKALRAIGVTRAQGYFLGRPVPLANAAALCRRGARDTDDVESTSA
ncbi:MAG TPA: EAL domain-containing protein [Burkholderiales bacterium]|nr:EAL domain-containing protein [Burkholderiales bacterium]